MTTQTTEQASRVKRISISTILPTTESALGTITINVVGAAKSIIFSYHVPANLSDLLLKAIEAGFVSRFILVASGIKEAEAIVTKVEAEVELLSAGTFTLKGAATKTVFADIIYAYGLSELANVADLTIASAYQAKWDALTKEEKQTLRSSSKVKRQLNNIENARLDAEEAAQAKADLAVAIAAE